MANYPKELTDLVEEYLTDGIISTKERQVLLKKAVALGVDADEFDLYIDAQQQKADQQVDAASRKQRGKTCPFCGGIVPQLVDKCPHCGETITAEASAELSEIFDYLEDALVALKSQKDTAKSKAEVERYSRKAKMYYENNPKVQKLLKEIESEVQLAEERNKAEYRKNLVKNFSRNKWFIVAVEALVFLVLTGVWVICNNSFHSKVDAAEKVLQDMHLKYSIPSNDDLKNDYILTESEKTDYLKKAEIEDQEEENARKKGHSYSSSARYYRSKVEDSEKFEKITKEDWEAIYKAKSQISWADWDDTAFVFFIISLVVLAIMVGNIIYYLFFKK